MPDNPELTPRKIPRKTYRGTTKERGYDSKWRTLRELIISINPVCEWCQQAGSKHVHHKDHNTNNRQPENLTALCEACHMTYHAHLKRKSN